MTTWRTFADREFPRVIRELDLPCAEPVGDTGVRRCRRHEVKLGPVSRMCLACHSEAWDEVGRRYASAEAPTDSDRPALKVFPGKKHKPLPGQLGLLAEAESQ